MRQLAIKNQTRTPLGVRKPPFAESLPFFSRPSPAYPAFGPTLQRKPVCACGGGCPRCIAANRQSEMLPRTDSRPRFIGDIEEYPTLGVGTEPADNETAGAAEELKGRTGGGGCTNICNRAYTNSSLNGGGGGVICDGATKCACVFDVPPLRRGQCPGFDAIVVAHERRHLGDVDCNPSGGLHRPPFRDPSQATSSECTHRRESIAEMDRVIPIAAGICKTGIQSIRAQLQSWVTANCGGGSSP